MAGTVEYDGVTQQIPADDMYNLEIDGAGEKTLLETLQLMAPLLFHLTMI